MDSSELDSTLQGEDSQLDLGDDGDMMGSKGHMMDKDAEEDYNEDDDDEEDAEERRIMDKAEKDRWSAPRKVINEAMIRKAVVDEMLTHYDRADVPAPEEIELEEVKELVLSFQSIDRINSLAGFENLVKLQLDNNTITKIENLGHLVNLEWLDLSFNMITTIEGLENLTKLTDLSLYSNQIVRIGNGLDNLLNLQCLSLGHNLLKDLSELSVLRRFKKLRMITLKENEFSNDEEYRNLILAHATGLRYIDYEPVDPVKASEAKKMEINIEFEKHEEAEQKAYEAMKAEIEECSRMQEAGLEPLIGLGPRLIEKDELHVRFIDEPSYRDLWEQYLTRFESAATEERRLLYRLYLLRKANEKNFQSALKKVIDSKEENLLSMIETFNHRYKLSIRSKQPEVIEAAMNSVTELSDKLMELETLSLKQARELIEEYKNSSRKESQEWLQSLNSLTERLKNLDVDFMSQVRRQITAATSASGEGEDGEEGQDGNDGTDPEGDLVGNDGGDSSSKSRKEANEELALNSINIAPLNQPNQTVPSLLPGGERESYTTLISNAHDARILVIDRTESILTEAENLRHQTAMDELLRSEQTRRRQRVMEIYTICERYLTALGKEYSAAKAEQSKTGQSVGVLEGESQSR